MCFISKISLIWLYFICLQHLSCNVTLARLNICKCFMSFEICIYELDFSNADPIAQQCKNSIQNFMRHFRNKYIFKGHMSLKTKYHQKNLTSPNLPGQLRDVIVNNYILITQNNLNLKYKAVITMAEAHHAFIL